MVREMLFSASDGIRTAEDFSRWLYVADQLGRFFHKNIIEGKYNDWLVGKETATNVFWDFCEDLRYRGLDDGDCMDMAEAIIALLFTNK